MYKKTTLIIIFSMIISAFTINVHANEQVEISSPSAILMDFSTGEVLYEKNADERRAMASVTKIMTLLIAMEEIHSGNLNYDDIITGSEYAKSFGGSTIFLDAGEKMSVKDIIKGIAVASGNDASVAIAEHICGSEKDFVVRMNEKAQLLGMENTNFINCNGLDAENHYSSARDIAVMSRELMKYDDIFKFTGIWMDSLRNGEFTLSNTNKLIRYYDGATGLKTGSTDNALFCVSATAKRNNMHLIAVIMGAQTSKMRQSDASKLLDFGFSAFKLIPIVEMESVVENINIEKGDKKVVNVYPKEDVFYIDRANTEVNYETIIKNIKNKKAPVQKGDIAGTLSVRINNNDYREIDIIFGETIHKKSYKCTADELIRNWMC